jgi:hypothetical protein
LRRTAIFRLERSGLYEADAANKERLDKERGINNTIDRRNKALA